MIFQTSSKVEGPRVWLDPRPLALGLDALNNEPLPYAPAIRIGADTVNVHQSAVVFLRCRCWHLDILVCHAPSLALGLGRVRRT